MHTYSVYVHMCVKECDLVVRASHLLLLNHEFGSWLRWHIVLLSKTLSFTLLKLMGEHQNLLCTGKKCFAVDLVNSAEFKSHLTERGDEKPLQYSSQV